MRQTILKCKRISLYVASLLIIATFASCGIDLEQETFNVYIQPNKGGEEYLGEVKGISNCRETASIWALYNNLREGEWDYTCCLKTADSKCAKKYK